ncbi:hypothetical protein [Helicobacter apodemus]|uniref:Uncharacterized protein n=1 Tax=Helicobacter apodemus TaxID=135569 RepID=A0A2U8FBV7_9HELI|nr:hypothetical protein [Helicobacter apodemus]AWI33731.1 hypothetical protein CDV25_02370 [Helicobacter apodemus]
MEARIFNEIVLCKVKFENEVFKEYLIEFINIIPKSYYQKLAFVLNDRGFNISLNEFARIFKKEMLKTCEQKAYQGHIKNFVGTRLQEIEIITKLLYSQEIKKCPKWVQEA